LAGRAKYKGRKGKKGCLEVKSERIKRKAIRNRFCRGVGRRRGKKKKNIRYGEGVQRKKKPGNVTQRKRKRRLGCSSDKISGVGKKDVKSKGQ